MKFNKFLSCFLAAVIALQNSQAIFAGEKGGVNRSFALSSLMVEKNKGLCISSENPNGDLSCYDKYVKVIDNKYVLELPENVTLSNDVIAKIQQQMDLSNRLYIYGKFANKSIY